MRSLSRAVSMLYKGDRAVSMLYKGQGRKYAVQGTYHDLIKITAQHLFFV